MIDSQTLFIWAISGDIDRISAGWDKINKSYQDDAFHAACKYGNKDVVEFLLDHGTNVHHDNEKALRYAAENGHADTVKLLLSRGADVHYGNDYALRVACHKEHVSTIRVLLCAGAYTSGYSPKNPEIIALFQKYRIK